jgi:hypothetical protein
MSKAQWLYNYIGIINQAKEDKEFQVTSLHKVLVNVLGLNLTNILTNNLDSEEFIPLVLLAGNHHLLKAYLDEYKDNNDTPVSTVSDLEYEEQLKRMNNGMEPIIDTDILNGLSINEILTNKDLELLNIKKDSSESIDDILHEKRKLPSIKDI